MSYVKKALFGASVLLLCTQAFAQVTFYEGEDFHGRAFTATGEESNFRHSGFNDRASSAVVQSGRWEVCEDAGYRGHCVLLRPGSYESLRQMGMNDRVSSVRRVSDRARYDGYMPDPMPAPTYEYRRRPNEHEYQAQVISVHAVMGPPEQHCWVERDEVERGNPSVAGTVVGGIIGGILGHEIVGGRGQGAATVGGAVAGAAIGSNAGRDTQYSTVERHCQAVDRGPPDYWDVTYEFRNVTHHVQMSSPPGRTISVNRQGEPRD